jgi:hypothetical protein
VPLTVTIKIVLENVPGLEPIGVLMGTGNFVPGRWRFLRSRWGGPAEERSESAPDSPSEREASGETSGET